MSKSLVEQLRSCARGIGLSLVDQAADRIEELEAKIAAALKREAADYNEIVDEVTKLNVRLAAAPAQEPVGWRDFLVQLSATDGGMVSGNRISRAAKELLASQTVQSEPDEPCDNCGLGHPSSNCIYKPVPADLLPPLNIRSDRDMLSYLMQAFDNEVSVCGRCGESEPTEHMDSAKFLRQFLAAAPTLPETWKVLPSQPGPDAAAIRAAALEEAAKACMDNSGYSTLTKISFADAVRVRNCVNPDPIRALIGGSKP